MVLGHIIFCSLQLLIFILLEAAKPLNICIKNLFASLKEHKLKVSGDNYFDKSTTENSFYSLLNETLVGKK